MLPADPGHPGLNHSTGTIILYVISHALEFFFIHGADYHISSLYTAVLKRIDQTANLSRVKESSNYMNNNPSLELLKFFSYFYILPGRRNFIKS
jgi:hypothetical protein